MCRYLLPSTQRITLTFFLESEEHRNGYDGYNVISHIPKEDPIPIIFPKLFQENEGNIRILLKNGRRNLDKQQFDDYCKAEYFEKHIKAIMLQRVFTLPDAGLGKSSRNPIIQAPFDVILKTMENWCNKYQEEGNIKGLVIFGYRLDDHLRFLKYPDNILKNYLNNKTCADFQETVTVYNPQKRVIFLLRRATDKKDLEYEMKSSVDDALKFVFLYNDILKDSGIKLINLLITDQDVDFYQWKWKFCKQQVISINSLDSLGSFQKWLDKKEYYFETDYNPANKKNNFSDNFSSKILGFLASFQFSKEHHFHSTLPSLSDNPVTQMAETTILLTLEQLEIVNSPNKHVMIQGCYGSGKSLIALKKAEMTSKTLKQNELLYFISYDSSSMLTKDIVSIPKMKLYRNESALKLSHIINGIKKKHPKRNINLIVDEYDPEHLDKPEAERLNKIFTTDEKFSGSIICLVFEALERERIVHGIKKRTNLHHLLTSMELKRLTYNKRNTLEIHNLVKVTTGVLQNLTTTVCVPDCPVKSLKTQSGLEKTFKKERNGAAQGESSTTQQQRRERDEDNDIKKNVIESKKLIFDEAFKYLRYPIDESIVKEVTTVRVPDYTAKSLKIQSGLEKTFKEERNGAAQGQDSTTQQQRRERDEDNDIRKIVSESKKLTFDEACKYLTDPTDASNVREVTTAYRHRDSVYSGHHIVSEKPNVYKIYYFRESAEFMMSLIAVLEQVIGKDYENINKHVILHFDVEKDIPWIFNMAFTIMGILDKVTNRYEEFQKISGKKIFIADFRAFRGLEYPRVVVVLDRNLCGLEHYLPECLNRCTTYLHALLLNEKGELLKNPLLKDVITSWSIPQFGGILLNSWTVYIYASNANQVSEKFCEKIDRGQCVLVHSTSRKYKELEKILFQALEIKNTNQEKVNQQEINSAVVR